MSVRKRTWSTSRGETKEAWIVDYTDQDGERHIQTFARKKDADEYHATGQCRCPPGRALGAEQEHHRRRGRRRLDRVRGARGPGARRPSHRYRQHVDLHIKPRIGREKLAKLTTPRINAFRDDLLANMSRAMAKKVLTSLKSLLRDASGAATSPRTSRSTSRSARTSAASEAQGRRRHPDSGRDQAHRSRRGRHARPLLLTAIFTGLRSSELRGLRWEMSISSAASFTSASAPTATT